ncbi:ATP-binding cassette domain-containing protein [Radiobacillus kanasensis]|uniref:methionine ABC transporter ATP-binding protein n=1 Tax=Radiobacillus kanasensis TaxID=2844358 RepID=UPI001E427B74|nr:ATP-binding cassette domain-containing protein [Radiobacillus kanasensis]UFT98931.1 ATP-binding cassette domain-containing protein [Radiobacillus kanasensis]
MITFDQVNKVFKTDKKEVHAVKDVSLTIEKGEIFGVVGFSGAGKSTLIRLVNLLERPTSGTVKVHNSDLDTISSSELRKLRRRIGMIFQSFNLFNSRTVYGNIAYPLKLAKKSKKEIEERVQELLRFVGLQDKSGHYPEQLSGGQKQRVGIARALATSPDILICDEATSALDPETTGEILQLLQKVNKEYGITILLITHEMHVIRSICDRMAVMENGSVIEYGNVYDIFTNPQSSTSRNFVSSVLNDKMSLKLLDRVQQSHKGKLFRLIFTGVEASEPILSRVTKKHQLEFSIIYGSINELQDQLFGSLIVEFIGPDELIEVVIEELKKTVEVREVINHES